MFNYLSCTCSLAPFGKLQAMTGEDMRSD